MIKNNFNEILKKAQSENRAALFVFVTGYHPNYETSKLIIKEISKFADAIEIGNPFNTSTADSSVIMNASETAIKAGANTQKILDLVKEIKSEKPKFSVAIMGYLISIHGYNIDKYVKECKKSMVDACIVVDSSLDCPEDDELFKKLKREEISFVKLVTPTND